MHLSIPFLQLSIPIILILSLTPPSATASAVSITKSACVIPTTTITATAIESSSSSSWTLLNYTSSTTTTSVLPASTTPLWQIDPQCLPGVAQCHHFGDRFRYCNATGFWIPNYCGGDWICCAYSSRNGVGPMCEAREKCEVTGQPWMVAEGWV
jgi:hypothetical protein